MNELTETKNNLVYIEVERLHPHPDNPRKELGDLTELAESIKSKGIMQNLTVVPCEDSDYTVIIGHRRMAAAKLAGLTELPCVITEMSEQDQVATMLLENMQRSDLTVYEQAQGFQMMFDFGETIETIAEKTGFSESTVRRRIKLTELDQEKLKAASARQLTFAELDRLSKITDINARNKVLEDIGTNNFEYSYRQALNAQERVEKEARFKEIAAERGFIAITDAEDKFKNYTLTASVYALKDSELAKLEKLNADTTYYYDVSCGLLFVYAEKSEEETAAEIKKKEERERRNYATTVLTDASRTAFELRLDFIRTFPKNEAKKRIGEISALMTKYHYNLDSYFEDDTFKSALGIDADDDTVDINAEIEAHPEYALLCCTYAYIGDSERENYFSWSGEYTANDTLDAVYDFLKSLGYEMSDEELALQNGTSELFLREAPEVELIKDEDEVEAESADEDSIAVDELISELIEEYGDGNDG